MELDVLDYLFIDYLCDLPATLAQICSKDAAEIFNKPYHNLDEKGVLNRLSRLEGAGLLSVVNGQVYLTGKGGAVWEEEFQPKWNGYILVEGFYRFNCEFVHIGCLEISVLDFFINGAPDFALSFSRVKYVDGWFPKYWKRFDCGYQVLAVVSDIQALDEYCINACASWRLWWKSSDFNDGLVAR